MLYTIARTARRFRRPGVAVLLTVALVLTAAACSRITTHEADGAPYDSFDEAGGATFAAVQASTAGISAYRGDAVAKAETPGDVAVNERGFGVLDLEPDVPYESEGWYAAAFYFPNGTFAGGSPRQRGDVDIMRWSGVTGQFGGIRIGPNHTASLVRGLGDSVTGTIGSEFSFAEGCWNWLAVHQKISTGAGAKNDVWLNGQKVVSADEEQNTATATDVTDVRFGYATADPSQDGPLTYYIDDATVGVEAAALAEPRAPVCGQPAPPAERPNILIFMTDDQRAGTEDSRPSAPGSPYLMQATRDRFMAEGEVYEEAFATTPQCCPSRASIFTGRYAHNHTVMENRLGENLGTTEDSANQQTTLQYYLKNRVTPGYRTAIFGKYLNSWRLSFRPPFFDDWAIFHNFRDDNPATPANEEQPHLSRSTLTPDVCETSGPNFEPSEACMAERSPSGVNVRKPLPSGVYETDFLAGKMANFLAEAEDTPGEDDIPWLVYVTPTVPHPPFTPKAESPDYRDLPIASFEDDVPPESLEGDRSDKPRYVRDNPVALEPETAETHHDAHLRMLKSADDLVQDVFDELDSRGETGTTLAFFLSDNGSLWGEHGLGGKHTPYEYSARIPLMTRWPGHPAQVPAGQRDQRLVANIDVAPTVMSALGIAPPALSPPMDGTSLFDAGARSRLLLEAWVKDPLPGTGERPLCEELGYCRPASAPPTPPGQPVPTVEPPTWATTMRSGQQGYYYTRYYLFDPSTTPPLENRVIFREFYPNADAFQLDNSFGPDGAPGGGDDLGFIPPDGILGSQLERDRLCRGHPPRGSWPPPCP
jgi:arylsulfatase A-like enzyme